MNVYNPEEPKSSKAKYVVTGTAKEWQFVLEAIIAHARNGFGGRVSQKIAKDLTRDLAVW